MDVLIKGMKMPNNCGECVLCNAVKDDEYDYEINTYCHATGESLESLDVRGDRCPLVEVPTPHGRLVDIEAVYKEITNYYKQRTELQHIALRECLSRVPTIIEAEEGANNEIL